MEQETVLDLACLRWQKQHVRKMWLAATYNDPFAIELIETGEKSFSGIRRHLRRQARDTHTMIGSIHAVFSELANQARKVSRALSEEGAKKDDIERAQNRLGALLSMMQERVLPLTRSLEEGPNAEQLSARHIPRNISSRTCGSRQCLMRGSTKLSGGS